ncbi:MAG: glycoside hydrolase family 73 protein [Bacillota bacterium]
MVYTQEFIESILPMAAETQRKTSLPAAIMVAQAVLETGYGKHIIKNPQNGKSSFNLFNIKGEGPAGKILISTLEFNGDDLVKVDTYFRAYYTYAEAFSDYAKLILNNSRYELAVAVAADPEKYAAQLQECGYATDPQYAKKLLNITKEWNLIERVKQIVSAQEEIEFAASEIPSAWAKESVKKAIASNVIIGYGEGIWMPRAPVTREMLAVILDRLGLLD